MSVDLWAWQPSCDDEGCCGDCDHCKKAEEMEDETDIVQVWIAQAESEKEGEEDDGNGKRND